MSDTNEEEQLYAQAAAELDGGSRDKGLWAKCFADCDGDENKAKALYLKTRVERTREVLPVVNQNANERMAGIDEAVTSSPKPFSIEPVGNEPEFTAESSKEQLGVKWVLMVLALGAVLIGLVYAAQKPAELNTAETEPYNNSFTEKPHSIEPAADFAEVLENKTKDFDDRGWKIFDCADGLMLRLPKDWEMLSGEMRERRASFAEDLVEAAGINLLAGKKRLLNAGPQIGANGGYARARLSIEPGEVLSQTEARDFVVTQPIADSIKQELLRDFGKINLFHVYPESISLNKVQSSEGYEGILISYKRTSTTSTADTGDVLVNQFKVYFSDKIVLLTTSYNLANEKEWKPITDDIWASLRFTDKRLWPHANDE